MAIGNPRVTVGYVGGDRLRAEVRGHQVFTDQPVEDGGGDTAATPTELFVASLAACVTYYAERFLRRNGLTTEGLLVGADWTWADGPHRVGAISLTVDAPGLTREREQAFGRVIEHCTIHNTLRHPPEVDCTIHAGAKLGTR